MYCLFFALYSILTLPMKNAIKDIYDGQMQALLLVTTKTSYSHLSCGVHEYIFKIARETVCKGSETGNQIFFLGK